MKVTLDGKDLFGDRLNFETGSVTRDSIEKAAAGLDGIVSIDLGRRGRTIRQSGTLRAGNREQLRGMTEEISSFIDGMTHTLETPEKVVFENVRMDSFEIIKENFSGAGVTAKYVIVYKQLVV